MTRKIHITDADIDTKVGAKQKICRVCAGARALNRTYPEAEDTISVGYEYVLVGTDQDLGKLDTHPALAAFARQYDGWRVERAPKLSPRPGPISFEWPELEEWIAKHASR